MKKKFYNLKKKKKKLQKLFKVESKIYLLSIYGEKFYVLMNMDYKILRNMIKSQSKL